MPGFVGLYFFFCMMLLHLLLVEKQKELKPLSISFLTYKRTIYNLAHKSDDLISCSNVIETVLSVILSCLVRFDLEKGFHSLVHKISVNWNRL